MKYVNILSSLNLTKTNYMKLFNLTVYLVPRTSHENIME